MADASFLPESLPVVGSQPMITDTKVEPLSPDPSAEPSNQRTYYCRCTPSQQPSLLKSEPW
jgi:hypothetical protein